METTHDRNTVFGSLLTYISITLLAGNRPTRHDPSDKTIQFDHSINSNKMRRSVLLAVTALMLAGPLAYAGGGKAKKQTCTHCTKQNCTGAKCAQCCKDGKCTKA